MKTRALPIFLGSILALVSLVACKDDEKMLTPIDVISGTYTGVYKEQGCPPFSSIELDDVRAQVIKESDIFAGIVLSVPGVGNLLSCTAEIDSDTSFTIGNFFLDGNELWGRGRFSTDNNLRFWLTDGCTFFGDTVAIAIYDGDK